MNARLRYVTDSVETASPARLLVQLYDRLVLDLTRGEQALTRGDRSAASEQILHAQDIITELHATLQVDAWSGAAALSQIYTFCLGELIRANIDRDAGRVGAVRGLLEPLRDSWRVAAETADISAPASLSA